MAKFEVKIIYMIRTVTFILVSGKRCGYPKICNDVDGEGVGPLSERLFTYFYESLRRMWMCTANGTRPEEYCYTNSTTQRALNA